MYVAFKSTYGYNTTVREGKLYYLSKNTIKYLLEVNKDLILLSFFIKMFCLKVRSYLFFRFIKSRYRIFLFFIKSREIGKTNLIKEKNEYNKYYNICI